MSSQDRKDSSGKTAAIKFGKDSGRVKVYARVRPLRPQENSRKEAVAVNVLELGSQIHVIDPRHSWEKTYKFDHVFPPESTNQEVCNALCRPIVNSALNGFNGTLMAYGQTGSGKTHTLMGPDGITSGVIERCFKKISQDEYHDFKVTLSYLQIYQEKIYDLLNSTNKVDLALREHPDKGVYVENLSEFVVRSPSEVHGLLTVGRKRLVFAETKMNRTSSRSHSVIQLKIERTANKDKAKVDAGKEPSAATSRELKHGHGGGSRASSPRKMKPEERDKKDIEEQDESFSKMVSFNDDVLIRGRIYLCDLAGSERLKKTLAEGERLSEAQHINSSLLELGNVIQALAEGKKTHVPFRNSTLTRLMQESLGGNCKTSLMVCVSPAMSDVSETKTTLNFGLRAMKITNTAYVNVEVDYKRLSDDLAKLLEIRDNDMVKLKDSYDTRIEKMRREAEAKLTEIEADTDMALSSIRSLSQESQRSDLQREVELLQSLLEEQKCRAKDLQLELAAVENQSHEHLNRTKSLLLQELISAQLYYAIRDLAKQEDFDKVCCDDDSSEATRHESKEMILDNAHKLLDFLEGYLKLWNTSPVEYTVTRVPEVKPEDPCRLMIARPESFGSAVEDCKIKENGGLSTHLNKTDDDKVVEIGCAVPTVDTRDSLDRVTVATDTSGKISWVEKAESLKCGMLRIKENLDREALGFLKQAFYLKDSVGVDSSESRREVYSRLKELLVLKDDLATESNDEVHSASSLEHSLCHVLVDKALQNSVLVLEQAELKSKCAKLLKHNRTLELQLLSQQKQSENLQVQNTSLNEQFSQTVTILKVVKEQKEKLEGEFSSVFQLYNMTNGVDTNEEPKEDTTSPFVDKNASLKEDLALSEQRNRALKRELDAVKSNKSNIG